ncbi:nitrate reductase [Rhodoblastus acidophilus]|uniref:Nitrate reductase n=1 Tax=Candidatus Rhodoblastus alkanivorans TaxID=2954117 RepID=A0ABS9Z8Q0_9HYPH|nr:nitrate reductase [Candidatus Rhodoblastus alkanivorans]MCI4678967.1 nitrate reductase [Candidatus Rhodoblastus alkanivorans]MCI4683745.1 nitrate reductase [Candidatus Rhodoblastus alkanivorans]MDI4641063.1 nitrate reductase [Rhodoblastus acidophilus]
MTKTISTTCPYCGVGCGVSVEVSAESARVSGDKTHPANFGRLCVKGASLAQVLTLEERLLHPRIAGARASWDEALETVARVFSQTIAAHGPDSVAFYVSGQLLTEDYYVANKLMKGFIGSANIDTNSRLCMSSSVAGHKRAFGADTVPGCYEDLEAADLVVLVGSNLAWCHPILFQRLAAARAKRNGLPLVVNIDPRRTATSEIADLQLSLAPGSDVALFSGLLRELNRAGKRAKKFVSLHTHGVEESLAAAKIWTLDRVAAETGLNKIDLRRFYDLVIENEKSVTVYSQGVNQSSSGTDKVNAIINTHLLTGRIGKPGCGPFSVTGQPNAMGGREVGGLANMLAAHMELDNPVHRALAQDFWGAPAILDKPGLKAVDLFKAIDEGRVKAVWIIATNPADSLPDADFVRAALKKCPFVVLSDVAEKTDSAALAHVLLPAAAWGEKDGTVTNSERRISRQRKLREAPDEARADWEIVCDVARRMGFGQAFAFENAAAIFREHAALSGVENNGARDFDISACADISDEDYDALAPFQWPWRKGEARSDAPRRFFADGGFFTPDGRARFVATPFRGLAQKAGQGEFVLNTGRVRDQWHTMTRTGRAEQLSQHIAEPFAELNPLDAAMIGVEHAGLVKLSNARGLVLLRAQITDRQRRGSVFAPIHWTDQFASNARVDALVATVVDPFSGQPESKGSVVGVEPFDASWHAFALSRAKPRNLDCAYWAMARIEGGWRVELAGSNEVADWEDFARRLFGLGAQEGEFAAMHDARSNAFRGVATGEGQVLGALFVAPGPVAVARSWACEEFASGDAAPLALVAGRPPRTRRDPGRKICVCLNVGANVILDAIAEKQLGSGDAISAATGAGTGCGSCRPEIQRLLDQARMETPQDNAAVAASNS